MADLTQKIKKLYGHTPQGHAGQLDRESQYVWRYTTSKSDCELSLAMPIRAASYNSSQSHPIFSMNLPEGDQFYRLSQRFKKTFAKFDEMAILSIVGHDQIGRVQLTQELDKKRTKRATVGLAQIKQSQAHEKLFDYLAEQYYDTGISGAQPKVMVPDADVVVPDSKSTARNSDLIIKTGGLQYPFLSQNEYVCMLAAQKAGIEVPEFHLSDDGSLYIMRRFDLLADGTKLGFEDFAVLGNAGYDVKGNYKYQGSYEAIAKIIGAYCGDNNAVLQKQNYFEYLTLSCMVRNGDAHLKNFGLMYTHPAAPASISLAPLFDVVTTSAYDHEDTRTQRVLSDRTLALRLNKSDSYPTRKQLADFGRTACHVAQPEHVIQRIGQAMTEVMQANKTLFSKAFGDRMALEWDNGKTSLA
jgi:serine/threonine-protein kinase HipA